MSSAVRLHIEFRITDAIKSLCSADYETSTIMPLGAEAALMWHDILHITFERLLTTIHFLNRIRLRQDLFESGRLKDILAIIDPHTANQARKAYFVLLRSFCEAMSQCVLDLILHWKRMQSTSPATANGLITSSNEPICLANRG